MTDTQDSNPVDSADPDQLGRWVLWFAVLGGLTAWMVRLLAGATLVPIACRVGWGGELALYLISFAGVAVTAVALVMALRIRRQHVDEHEEHWSAVGFLGAIGVFMNAISLALIVAESASIPFIPTCQAT